MANQTPIAKWVFANRATFHPTVEQLTWPNRYFPGVYDFSTTLVVNDTKVVGRGVDRDQLIAVEKSFAEAIERFIGARLKIDSEGFAVGETVGGAHSVEEHARNEAFERFYFFRHLRERICFQPAKDWYDTGSFEYIKDKFCRYNKGFDVPRICEISTPGNAIARVVVLCRDEIPAFLGLSYARDIDSAIWHAFLEAMPNFARYRDFPFTFDAEVAENHYWNCDPDFLREFTHYYIGGYCPEPVANPPLRKVAIDLNKIPELLGAPITVAKFVVDERKVKAAGRDRTVPHVGQI